MAQAKRFKKKWLFAGFVCAGLILFHQPLLVLGCKIALKRAIPPQEGRVVTYEQLQWEEGAIVLSGLHIDEPGVDCIIDRVSLKFFGDFFRARFAPSIEVLHPQISLKSSDSAPSASLGFLYRSRFFQPRWTIKNGVLQLPSSRFYFSMDPGSSKEQIGLLKFSHDPDPLVTPLFSAEIGKEGKQLQIGFKLKEKELDRLMPLVGLIYADRKAEWERACGEIELEGMVSLKPAFAIDELHVHGVAKEVALSSSKMGVILDCYELQGSFSFPAEEGPVFFWDRFSASFVLSRGECFFSEPLFEHTFGMKNLNGTLGFQPQKEPQLILNGTLLQEKRKVDFSLLGTGGVQENSTFWSEIDFVLGSLRGNQMHSVFSLCTHEDASLAVHAKVENARFDHIDFLRAFLGLPGECVEGVASAEAMVLYKDGWQSVALENCSFDKMRWYFPQEQVTVFSELIEGSCNFSAGEKWGLEDAHLRVQEGDYIDPAVHAKHLSADVTLEKQVLQASSLSGEWKGLKAVVSILGPDADHFADLQVNGDAKEFLTQSLPVSLQIAVQKKGDALDFDGSGIFAEEEIRGNAAFTLAENFSTPRFKEGKLFAEKLTEKSYGKFVPLLNPDLKLSGDVSCEASFFPARAEVKLGGEKLRMHHPVAQFYLPELKERPAKFAYDAVSKKWHGEIPISQAQLNLDSSYVVDEIQGIAKLEKNGGAEWNLVGNFHGMSLPVSGGTWIRDARCDLAFDSQSKKLRLENAEGTWKLKSGAPYTVKMTAALDEKNTLDFALKLLEKNKAFACLEGSATQTSSGWQVQLQPQTTHFGGTPLQVRRCTLNTVFALAALEMAPVLKSRDLQPQMVFLQDAGFLSDPFPDFKEWKLEGTLQSKISSPDMSKGFSFQVESNDLKVKGESLASFSLRGQKKGKDLRIEQLSMDNFSGSGALALDTGGISCSKFEGNWKGLLMKGSGFVKTAEKRFACAIESLKGDLSFLKLNTAFLPKGTFVAAAALKGDFSELLRLEGEAKFFIDLHSPLPVSMTSRRSVKFSYDKNRGLVCSGLDAQLKHKISGASLAELEVGKCIQRGEDFSLEQMQFSLSPALLGHSIDAKIAPAWLQEIQWEGNLEGSGDFKRTPSSYLFQGSLSPGRYGFDGKDLPFEQLQVRYEKDIFTLKAKAQIQQEPLWASLQVDLAKEPYGVLKLFDHPKSEGLKIHFKTTQTRGLLQSIQGSCYGLTCSLTKSGQRSVSHATVLTGEIQLDGNALCPLLPQAFRFGKGYQWQGDLVLWNEAKKGFAANGVLSGKDFEALGYRLHRLHAEMEATPERICLSQLRIEDPAGSVQVKKIEISKADAWNLNIPHISIRGLRPSLMEKIDSERGELKPFMIKDFTLTDIRGQLGKIDSLQGSAHLTFVNQFKKEASVFDAPVEMLKKLGLDLGILTPVQGEIQMELHGDKFYLISLDNAFSEGDRSEFYLAPQKNLSFIGLDGKMSIDLKMRQDVVLKITEPLTLTIRGTLDKPRYGLQF